MAYISQGQPRPVMMQTAPAGYAVGSPMGTPYPAPQAGSPMGSSYPAPQVIYSGARPPMAGGYQQQAGMPAAVPSQGHNVYQTPQSAAPRYVSQPQAGAPVTRTMAAPGMYTQGQPQHLPAGARVIRTSQGAPMSVRAAPGMAPGVTAKPNTIAGPGYTQGAYEVKHQHDPQLQNLKELRKTCGLKNIPVESGLKTFKKTAIDGQLSRETFLEAYNLILEEAKTEHPSDEVKNAVFDLFDRDDNHVVDMMELICGISLLCSGSEDDKIHAVFNVFDENGDGYISMDEMYKFLTSVFKVVLTPVVIGAMNSMGVNVESAEDLASVTSLECFKTADLNHDGKLSVAEFKQWFYAPRNDPSFLFSPVRKLLQ
ncbi:unnamed protein product [Polarella glacialis]|uniref:EF-hand domain-containing protein n=1 Tax=Polarella glacialis TaxID=89957 RepID=A0A813K0R0_POLGL|nr:unnamed protein product [Polarella glacialis]|mmetsp:Transcript_10897/g.17376  ORF Transcript_10897/g.17376 Transcript_10897/m.17376 type:complete len:369 (+) Transcript_10897:122-1228(+)